MTVALAVSQLVKTWKGLFGPEQHALRGLTLSVPTGAAFGLIGPNGAGKTTFIKVLLGVVRPTSGDVTVLGGDPQDTAIRARIGYLPERMHLPAALKGRDFLRSVSTLKGLSPADLELDRLLERVGLRTGSQRVGTFSKGMRQRLGLAAAMLGQPELLILDEPTDGIDPVGRVEVRALLLEEKKRGATILLNSHLLAETERICDRIGVLEHGQLRLEGTLDDVRRAASCWVVRFEGEVPAIDVEAAGFTRVDGAWSFEGDVQGLNEALDGARSRGLRVVALTPQTRDLEAVLTDSLTSRESN
ncbi:MAG: ABC transporter ATP-binding protein [Archangium sp.]|nr:ABC transporter ATP-binding protein [Archangium sp.]